MEENAVVAKVVEQLITEVEKNAVAAEEAFEAEVAEQYVDMAEEVKLEVKEETAASKEEGVKAKEVMPGVGELPCFKCPKGEEEKTEEALVTEVTEETFAAAEEYAL